MKLRIEWPVYDDAMFDREAITEAAMQWPGFAEGYQVTVLESPRIWVEPLAGEQASKHRANRLVVCEAPVIQRIGVRRAA